MLAGLAIWTAVASMITAILYAWDKWAAIKGRYRVAEQTLLLFALVGGWPGGLAASQLLRHKTQKTSYRVKFSICVVLNAVIMISMIAAGR